MTAADTVPTAETAEIDEAPPLTRRDWIADRLFGTPTEAPDETDDGEDTAPETTQTTAGKRVVESAEIERRVADEEERRAATRLQPDTSDTPAALTQAIQRSAALFDSETLDPLMAALPERDRERLLSRARELDGMAGRKFLLREATKILKSRRDGDDGDTETPATRGAALSKGMDALIRNAHQRRR